MSLSAICHGCGRTHFDWTLKQATASVGKLQHWNAHLCEDCTAKLEQRIVDAIKELRQ